MNNMNEFAIIYDSIVVDKCSILLFTNVTEGHFMSSSSCIIHILNNPTST